MSAIIMKALPVTLLAVGVIAGPIASKLQMPPNVITCASIPACALQGRQGLSLCEMSLDIILSNNADTSKSCPPGMQKKEFVTRAQSCKVALDSNRVEQKCNLDGLCTLVSKDASSFGSAASGSASWVNGDPSVTYAPSFGSSLLNPFGDAPFTPLSLSASPEFVASSSGGALLKSDPVEETLRLDAGSKSLLSSPSLKGPGASYQSGALEVADVNGETSSFNAPAKSTDPASSGFEADIDGEKSESFTPSGVEADIASSKSVEVDADADDSKSPSSKSASPKSDGLEVGANADDSEFPSSKSASPKSDGLEVDADADDSKSPSAKSASLKSDGLEVDADADDSKPPSSKSASPKFDGLEVDADNSKPSSSKSASPKFNGLEVDADADNSKPSSSKSASPKSDGLEVGADTDDSSSSNYGEEDCGCDS